MIWFNSFKARKQLMENHVVVTARKMRRSTGIQKAFYRDERGNTIYLCVVKIELLEYSNVFDEDNRDHKRVLSKYIENSGFDTVNEWVEEIKKLNNNRWIPETLTLLKVVYFKK